MIWFQIELQHRSLHRHISRHHQTRGEGGRTDCLFLIKNHPIGNTTPRSMITWQSSFQL